jgi:outer membrane protein TolC
VAGAEAELRAAEAALQSIELQLRFRTQERLAQLEATRTAAALYDDGVVPQDRMSMDAALAGYQAGRAPFLAVLEALTTLYLDRGALVALQAAGTRIRASLEEASLESTSELAGGTPANMNAERPGAAAPGGGTRGGSMGPMGR